MGLCDLLIVAENLDRTVTFECFERHLKWSVQPQLACLHSCTIGEGVLQWQSCSPFWDLGREHKSHVTCLVSCLHPPGGWRFPHGRAMAVVRAALVATIAAAAAAAAALAVVVAAAVVVLHRRHMVGPLAR